MKKIYGFAALCAALSLASCSNNDEPVVNPDNGGEKITATGYLSVNIANADKSTRANHNEFIYGSDAESKASKATFVFFDAGDNFITVMKDQALTSTSTPSSASQNVERDYTVLVPVEVSITKSTNPDAAEAAKEDKAAAQAKIDEIAKVVCILNPTDAINKLVDDDADNGGTSDAKINKVADVLKVVSNFSTKDLTKSGEFVMSNSVYWDVPTTGDPKLVYAQDCTGKIQNNGADALETPIDIYVERAVARVDAYFANNFKSEYATANDVLTNGAMVSLGQYNATTKAYDYEDVELDIKVIGMQVANCANTAYLVKNLGNPETAVFAANTPFAGWNAPTYFRSHWANAYATGKPSKTAASNYDNFAYATDLTTNFPVVTESATDPTIYTKYVNENINDEAKTSLVVTAQLVRKGTDTPVELVRVVKNGKYYTEASAKKVLLDLLQRQGYNVKVVNGTSTTYRSITTTDVEFVSDVTNGWEGSLAFAEQEDGSKLTDADIVRTTDGGKTYVAVPNFTADILKKSAENGGEYKVWKWNQGKCYFYVALTNGEKKTITNPDLTTYQESIDGVVRNHIYSLNLRSMVGLGVPVFDPTEIIIPNTPDPLDPADDDWHLACDIHILSWARYTQDVDFNQGKDNY